MHTDNQMPKIEMKMLHAKLLPSNNQTLKVIMSQNHVVKKKKCLVGAQWDYANWLWEQHTAAWEPITSAGWFIFLACDASCAWDLAHAANALHPRCSSKRLKHWIIRNGIVVSRILRKKGDSATVKERGPGLNPCRMLIVLEPTKRVCMRVLLLSVQILGAQP